MKNPSAIGSVARDNWMQSFGRSDWNSLVHLPVREMLVSMSGHTAHWSEGDRSKVGPIWSCSALNPLSWENVSWTHCWLWSGTRFSAWTRIFGLSSLKIFSFSYIQRLSRQAESRAEYLPKFSRFSLKDKSVRREDPLLWGSFYDLLWLEIMASVTYQNLGSPVSYLCWGKLTVKTAKRNLLGWKPGIDWNLFVLTKFSTCFPSDDSVLQFCQSFPKYKGAKRRAATTDSAR